MLQNTKHVTNIKIGQKQHVQSLCKAQHMCLFTMPCGWLLFWGHANDMWVGLAFHDAVSVCATYVCHARCVCMCVRHVCVHVSLLCYVCKCVFAMQCMCQYFSSPCYWVHVCHAVCVWFCNTITIACVFFSCWYICVWNAESVCLCVFAMQCVLLYLPCCLSVWTC